MNNQPYDAGHERQTLAEELANWDAIGFIDPQRSRSIHQRVKTLARQIGLNPEQTYEQLRKDAANLTASD